MTLSWEDITSSVSVYHSSRSLYDRKNRCFFIQAKVTNNGTEAISGPIRMVITNPTIPVKTDCPVGVTPDGYTDEGNPYFVIVPGGEELGAGSSTDMLRINFELQRKRLGYGIRVEQIGSES